MARRASPKALPVFIVVGVRLYGEGLLRMLAEEDSLDVLGAGPADDSSLLRIAKVKPWVVLADSGSACSPAYVRKINSASPESRVVAFGVTDDEREVVGCAEAGVVGYIAASVLGAELAESLRTLQAGGFPCPAAIASILLGRAGGRAPAATLRQEKPDARLTPRESAVLALVDRGLTNKQIAASLSIELPTVKNHVHNILGKLGVARRGVAAARLRAHANESQDLDPGPGPGPGPIDSGSNGSFTDPAANVILRHVSRGEGTV
jgi:two-component system, NarL family, nitrate/nitrite response regulator NarL